jgi:hypothetical protein
MSLSGTISSLQYDSVESLAIQLVVHLHIEIESREPLHLNVLFLFIHYSEYSQVRFFHGYYP